MRRVTFTSDLVQFVEIWLAFVDELPGPSRTSQPHRANPPVCFRCRPTRSDGVSSS